MTILKMERAAAIKDIIKSKNVADQKQLINELRKVGYNITQATLSRQLKEMGISKVNSSNGQYHYAQLGNDINENQKLQSYSSNLSIGTTHKITVIHTEPAYASPIAKMIEQQLKDMIYGTIAGIDTIFIALSDKVSEEVINEKIVNIIESYSFKD